MGRFNHPPVKVRNNHEGDGGVTTYHGSSGCVTGFTPFRILEVKSSSLVPGDVRTIYETWYNSCPSPGDG